LFDQMMYWGYIKLKLTRMLLKFLPAPPQSSYELVPDNLASKYSIRVKNLSDMHHCHRIPDAFEVSKVESTGGNQVVTLMVKSCADPKYIIIYSHGGTVDVGNICNFYYTLGDRLKCNILTYDYSGFGETKGEPTESNLIADAEAVYKFVREKYQIPPQKIILYGQSLGCALTIYLATKHNVAGVVIHSPFMSILRIAFPDIPITPFFDSFPNIDRIGKVTCPVLSIHGTADRVTTFKHGQELHKRCQKPVSPLWVNGGGHEDIYLREEYYNRLKKFINDDLRLMNAS